MRLRFAIASLAGTLAICLAAVGLAPSSHAADPADAPPVAALEAPKLVLEQLEARVNRDGLSVEALSDLRRDVLAIRDELRMRAAELDARRLDADVRLKELGAPPGKDAPPEATAVTAEREQIARLRGEIVTGLNQVGQLGTRADRLLDRINDRRRTIFTQKLFERSSGVFDGSFWLEAVRAIPDELRGIGFLLRAWASFAQDNGGYGRMAAALATLIAFMVAALAIRRRWRPHRSADIPADGRFAKAHAGLRAFAEAALPLPLAIAAVIATLNGYGLMPGRILEIATGLLIAIMVATFGRGVGKALLAPERPERRTLPVDDATARALAFYLTWSARALAAAVFLNLIHKEVVAPVALTVATSTLLALVIAALTLRLLWRIPRLTTGPDGETRVPVPGLRVVGWLVLSVIAVALVTGHVGFAAFVAERFVAAIAVFGALYLLVMFIDASFGEVLVADHPVTRAIAANLAMKPRTVELLGTLLSAVLRVTLVVAAVLIAIGQRGLLAVEVFGTMQDAVFGFRLGEITISLTAILGAIVLLVVGIVVTRGVQRWLETRLLPRTDLDPSLQLSISTILGYVGFIAAVSLALAHLGIDLQKIALVAGALSVGIGFGLQAIVSNFVSGLILLAERPIRVGDSIVVKGEEGWVRRIRVRATEIETFERATVIIPNSELISGMVKNWTHANTMGRIIVKVGVAYDCDPERVRDILMACASEHPQVMQTPPPRVFLLGFGDSALEFELRCVVANVEYGLAIKSDLHFAILRGLREAGIRIPAPQREVRLLGGTGATAAAATPSETASRDA